MLRAAELSADAVLKATQVDGVYTADPKRDPNARRYERLTHDEAITQNPRSDGYGCVRACAREQDTHYCVFDRGAGAIALVLSGGGRSTLVAP